MQPTKILYDTILTIMQLNNFKSPTDNMLDKYLSINLLHQPENFTFKTIMLCVHYNRKYLNILLEYVDKFDLLTNNEKEYLLLL